MDRAMGDEMNKMIDTMQMFMDKVKARADIVKNGDKPADTRNIFHKERQSLTTDMSSLDGSKKEAPIERFMHLRE